MVFKPKNYVHGTAFPLVLDAAGELDAMAREGIAFEQKNYTKGSFQKQKMLDCRAVVTEGL